MPHAKKIGIQKFLLLRLEFIVFFSVHGPPEKFYIAKNILVENKSCSTNMGEQLCQKRKIPTCLLSEIRGGPQFGSKIHVFHIFWPLDGVEITRKCRFFIGHDLLPLF